MQIRNEFLQRQEINSLASGDGSHGRLSDRQTSMSSTLCHVSTDSASKDIHMAVGYQLVALV